MARCAVYGILSRLRVVFCRGLCGLFSYLNLGAQDDADVDVAAIARRLRARYDATKVVATPSCLSESHT